ncbi:hypothetical protein HG530_014767 [Fusarium avenaceum]|nr:hypothetical protein HG530_014767 [Fusarium avenaceum]
MLRLARSSLATGGRARLTKRLLLGNTAIKTSECHEGRCYITAQVEARSISESQIHAESFLQGNAASYIDEMYRSWKVSPDSVHVSWRTYFRKIEEGKQATTEAIQLPPGYLSSRDLALQSTTQLSTVHTADALKLAKLVSAYRSMGHRIANLDPLGLQRIGQPPHAERPPDLSPSYHGFTTKDMDREFAVGTDILPHFASQGHNSMSLKEIVAACESVYCGSYGIEYQHISSAEKREWLRERLETPEPFCFSRDEKKKILDSLIWSTSFERFIATKFPTEKRFGLDGAEGLAPGIASLIDQSVDAHGVKDIVIGSCHRGRLTMLGTVYGKPREAILAEFAGGVAADPPGMAGDVKYHLGHDGHRVTGSGNSASVTLLANPSHLEAVDPVATGFTYATKKMRNDADGNRTMCIALHGDAAFAGQGVVYETLGLSNLDGYQVGGTVRVIVNNQIGFTTDAECSRSTPYPSDLAKYIDAPILHVNANDVEAVTFVFKLAADWRARFKEDIVIDLVCYRKFGHNEFDQPNFTQPVMYQQVANQRPTMELYIDTLVEQGTFTVSEIKEQQRWVWDKLNNEFEASKGLISQRVSFPPAWDSFPSPASLSAKTYSIDATAVDYSTLKSIADKVSSVPEGFELHPNLQRILAGRLSNFEQGSVDWSTAEALAFGTLCLEGHPVRLTGQDVQRGTFSQRHSILHDQVTGQTWTPLNNLSPSQAAYEAINSPLSEFGALGFEYGATLADPNPLVIWEAQFGDFANNAQVTIDNFIASGESKWLDRSGLVLSLPHGYDGQGAEHSSARLERFLSMCNEDGRTWPSEEVLDRAHQYCNMEVVYMTSPANYFHVLRRHLKREYRKPLIIFFSKSLLRHPIARSDISLFTDPTASFQPILADPAHKTRDIDNPEDISRVILCSGQVYASLIKRREDQGLRDTAITRLEELHPFPWREVETNLQKYPNVKNIVWTQEEPYNGGAWHYVRDRIDAVLRKSAHLSSRRLLYSGRGPSASPATGLKKIHQAEEENLTADPSPNDVLRLGLGDGKTKIEMKKKDFNSCIAMGKHAGRPKSCRDYREQEIDGDLPGQCGKSCLHQAKRPRQPEIKLPQPGRPETVSAQKSNPCFNCDAAGTKCKVSPSRRGRWPRGNGRQCRPAAIDNNEQEADTTPLFSSPQELSAAAVNPVISPRNDKDASDRETLIRSPPLPTRSKALATVFFGESNLLTLVPGRPGSQNDESQTKARLLFPLNIPPRSLSECGSSTSVEHVSIGVSRYLRDEGALKLPDSQACIPALQAYFTWFHPCFPILDRADFTRKLLLSQVPHILLQSMLFIGTTYCDNTIITSMGFRGRTEAKAELYTRARLLFHADCEKDPITLIQSLFLMSFWRGDPDDIRDVRYWLGVAIGLAESHGFHRSVRLATTDPHRTRIRKRIWWSIYVREYQAAASLGLPSRIKDDDCDVEPLNLLDLTPEMETLDSSLFDPCTPQHIAYVISMIDLIHIHDDLEKWITTLPQETNLGVESGTASVWGYLLHLAYKHVAVTAAARISRIAEDMLTQGTLRYGQMHLYVVYDYKLIRRSLH